MRMRPVTGRRVRPSSLSAQGFPAQEPPAPPPFGWSPSPNRERKKWGDNSILSPSASPPLSLDRPRRGGGRTDPARYGDVGCGDAGFARGPWPAPKARRGKNHGVRGWSASSSPAGPGREERPRRREGEA